MSTTTILIVVVVVVVVAIAIVALRKKERKVEALSGGFARPFHVTYLIRVWADTREALREKVAAVQAAIHGMDGTQYFECALPTTVKKWRLDSQVFCDDATVSARTRGSGTVTPKIDCSVLTYQNYSCCHVLPSRFIG